MSSKYRKLIFFALIWKFLIHLISQLQTLNLFKLCTLNDEIVKQIVKMNEQIQYLTLKIQSLSYDGKKSCLNLETPQFIFPYPIVSKRSRKKMHVKEQGPWDHKKKNGKKMAVIVRQGRRNGELWQVPGLTIAQWSG